MADIILKHMAEIKEVLAGLTCCQASTMNFSCDSGWDCDSLSFPSWMEKKMNIKISCREKIE